MSFSVRKLNASGTDCAGPVKVCRGLCSLTESYKLGATAYTPSLRRPTGCKETCIVSLSYLLGNGGDRSFGCKTGLYRCNSRSVVLDGSASLYNAQTI